MPASDEGDASGPLEPTRTLREARMADFQANPQRRGELIDRFIDEVDELAAELRQATGTAAAMCRVKVFNQRAFDTLPLYKRWLAVFEPFWLPPHTVVDCWVVGSLHTPHKATIAIYVDRKGRMYQQAVATQRAARRLSCFSLTEVFYMELYELIDTMEARRQKLARRREHTGHLNTRPTTPTTPH